MIITYILFTPLLILFLNFLLNKKNLFQSLTGDNHQRFVEKKNIPLSGGIVIILLSFFIVNFRFEIFYFIFIYIFLIGLLSDIKFIKSAKKRFLLQILTIFLFVMYYDLSISNVRVFFIDFFLDYKFFSYIFVTFCLLIVVNGSNFIDGLNGLVAGYYIIILAVILNLELAETIFNLESVLINYLIILTYLLIFNYINNQWNQFQKIYAYDLNSYDLFGNSIDMNNFTDCFPKTLANSLLPATTTQGSIDDLDYVVENWAQEDCEQFSMQPLFMPGEMETI